MKCVSIHVGSSLIVFDGSKVSCDNWILNRKHNISAENDRPNRTHDVYPASTAPQNSTGWPLTYSPSLQS